MKIKSHVHGGYYGDGNSQYWWTDTYLDTETLTVRIEHEDSYYGQLAGDSQFANRVDKKIEERAAIVLSADEQAAIVDVLTPLIETGKRQLGDQRFASQKQARFIGGRLAKAVKLAGESDFHSVDCLVHQFYLPVAGLLVLAHVERGYWKCEVRELGGE